VVVLPGYREEVCEIMKHANREEIPVFIRGSGTYLERNYRPQITGIVMNTHRLSKLEVFEENGLFWSRMQCRRRWSEVR